MSVFVRGLIGIVAAAGVLVPCALASAQQAAAEGVFRGVDVIPDAEWNKEPRVRPDLFRAVEVDLAKARQRLAAAPQERGAEAARGARLLFTLPTPDGGEEVFEVMESPVMPPALQARFPEIRTYVGFSTIDASTTARISATPKGLHAQVRGTEGTWYIDPFSMDDDRLHVAYRREDLAVKHAWACETPAGDGVAVPQGLLAPAGLGDNLLSSGEQLRTYVVAVSTTGEYSQFHGGTVNSVMAEIVIAINRVTGIYETELAIRLQLTPNNDDLIFLNAATDPFTNGSASALIGQNGPAIDGIIGAAAYDIGHNFSIGSGGLAGLGVVCSSGKARGITGLGSPVGDPFYVDYVAHEMGHQFGANHTFNGISGSCSGGNRNASTAYEPGSGSTVMAYAGICGGDNIQSNSIAFFHSASFDEIRTYVAGAGNGCATITNTANLPPTVSAGPNFTIPALTPFTLTATASDPNGNPLTYSWEQRDLGGSQALSAPDNGSSPLFISRPPVTSPSRTFPQLANVLSGVQDNREKLPALARRMDFRVTARDGLGGVNDDDMFVDVVATPGPFAVTKPAAGEAWGGVQTVQWDVVGTNAAPINTSAVNIWLSTNGGQTFTTLLASNTPNDGSEAVVLPAITTSQARIRVEAVGNIYFAVNGGNFSIAPIPLSIAFTAAPGELVDPGVATPVTVRIQANGSPVDPAAARLFTSIDNAPFTAQTLTAAGGDLWTGVLPPLACGESLRYYATAASLAGQAATSPANAPAAFNSTLPGAIGVLVEDSFAADTGWTVSGTALDGQWTRGIPAGGGDRGDPASAFDGDGVCFLTDNVDGNSDVDDGQTILTSPIFDFTGGGTLSYAYWFDDIATGPIAGGDAFTFETSSNGGGTWSVRQAFGTATNGWTPTSVAIPAAQASSQFRVRFTVSDVGTQNIVEAGVDAFRVEGLICVDPPADCPADLAAAFGTLDINDVLAFANGFNAMTAEADLSAAFGTFDINDVLAFATAFNQGCP